MLNLRVVLGLTVGALVAVALFAASRASDPAAEPLRTPEAVGGVVVETASAVVLPEAPIATATPTAAPTPATTAGLPAAPTTAASVATSPTPVVALLPPPATPTPPAALAVADPAEAVLTFYRAVVGEDFDAAYALWDERMRAAYPREPNLDHRFDETAEITFSQLSVAEMSGASATVQANFTETYESGASRQFVGYWRLALVDGRWMLAEPHY
ncbi:MAG: hypothetical protein QOI85_2191 [Chloroflexota bacterium]|jgi:hypothetical protein|nr:hypothetical protein [Chloroflexota bacterium]